MNRLSRALTVIGLSALTCLAAGVTAFGYEPSEEELDALEWGMTAEEVRAAISTPPDKVERVESAGLMQTLYTYDNVDPDGYYWYIIICASDEYGLDGINCHYPTDDADALFAAQVEAFMESGGQYDPVDENFVFFHEDELNHTVMIFNLGTEVQVSVFPLFAEEERGYNYNEDGKSEPQDEPQKVSPDTGIGDTAVIAGAAVIAFGAALSFGKKRRK